MDDLERTSESAALSQSGESHSLKPQTARMEMLDATAAIRLAETIAGSRITEEPDVNGALAACRDAAERGERVTTILAAEVLASAREAMRKIAQSRLGVVIHAVAGHGGEELSALVDVGWGVLCAAGPEDSFDLALIARRAAEDAGVPFVVVHALGHATSGAGRAVAMIAVPHEKACQAFVGASRLRPRHDPAHPSLAPIGDRAFTERVPFALGSALREYANVSGRRHDAFDKLPLGEPPLMLVGMGPVGDALIHAVTELRAHGYDVGAIHITSLRPFPGARLVKALSRALAVTVLEPADEPLALGGLLARELKSAFTDALTWAPGFPGIGRIPKLFVGVTGASFDIGDITAICENMLADERGRRSFSFADADHALVRPSASATSRDVAGPCAIRFVLDDAAAAEIALAATAAALAETLGLRAHGILTPRGSSVTVDISASREHARGGMARRDSRIVLATERGTLTADVAARLSPGAVLGVVGDAALSDAARAIARDKRVRIVPLDASADPKLDAAFGVAAACAGAAVAAATRSQRTAVDSAHVARAVSTFFASRGAPHPNVAADRARRAYETTHEALLAADPTTRQVPQA